MVRGNKLPPLAAEEGPVVRAADVLPSKVWDDYRRGTSELQRAFAAGYHAGIATYSEHTFDVPVDSKFERFLEEREYGQGT